ncbi:protein CANDIDATE G-PROTEIN COUPLED RECEPTOR 2-like [Zingiber officinale]|uniref:protein CANDIDATE G-PROTEIN COUPLED RECEPTOR 2-like n=1 Tax=Zingiber officinale TaxID=94328 RepID=UPI001C4AA869|nr:protein CANDIDATE G-PROTEIN COUPLED RECEPTOR 2-like [Zingiber officinale]XP_042459890.1 protein CANDIDATE G-PROTEIN COUPLED RECEPTOR 2-like [Zingiber officinale]XP_042459891.1 protein CANDIDATE G-PROTEIN COUPLED RECEPTOR 2-like [Zingiber officinale]XP_042459892.1 protein CANDIDATE G-PROTEIN COUPLED RECEPTOR 2-like [Zingiber officinale]XP_042459893.1 protein CANDIDATE G-PROTEIN COUPLED RECEPTOR 2-like [Zingiber officinale]
MRAPEQLLAEMSLTAASSDLPLATVHIPAASPSWFVGCHGPPYNLALIVPSALFVAYLGWLARKSFLKLTSGQSHLMVSYYALLWLVSLLNLFWCLVQVWQCTAAKESAWNMLSLFTETGMLFMEISLLAFLLQGSHAGGLDVLTRTFVVSGVIVAADTLLKTIYIYGFGVPLFADSNNKENRARWGLWIVHKLLLSAVYGFIFFMHHSKWRERLPARPSFYNYVCAMLLLNSMSLFGCLLASNGSGFGIWLFNLTTVCYHSLYLPLLYVVFLADFFQEEDMRLENVYYSEMKDAGFFDDDWD